ncbi:short-chain dehydrogenase/reductase SDR [Sporocytophaga myxococcoides]|uniref:Short-chain dehydrogenase/reductase SDR n=1 Tax=Sporocytophaga myxococcoides TaxID=153721 RepID=A0A098LFD9_9BACT|nr:SDR family oxidoreductase [Sporocytophaga myxococcoides]GAL85179.1 short-chain dehydrogenase/reductase SDR [Sporocytophaga myxococcoides]
MKSQRLKGQSAIVTGSSSGIGMAVAIELASEGAKVAINYSSSEKDAYEVVKTIEKDGGEAIAIKADVSREGDVKDMFKKTIATFGTVDILVNNAGIQKDASITEMTLEEWKLVLDINLTGQFLCSREAIKEYRKRGFTQNSCALGKIICMSSVHEIIPWSGHVNYSSSKGGVSMFMKSMAQEVGRDKIRVNAIAPGAIKTRINKATWETKEAEQKVLELIPYNRLGNTKDVAKVAVWLASDDSDYVHGTTIFVDGGMALYPGFVDNG